MEIVYYFKLWDCLISTFFDKRCDIYQDDCYLHWNTIVKCKILMALKKMSRKIGFSIIKEICYNWFVRHCSQRWQLISRGHCTCSHPEEPCPTPGSTPGYNPLQYLLRPPSWILAVNKQTDLDPDFHYRISLAFFGLW